MLSGCKDTDFIPKSQIADGELTFIVGDLTFTVGELTFIGGELTLAPGKNEGSISNGYANQSISKLKNVLLYFIEKSHGIFFTKMNKLLFYTDFLTYKTLGRGMTGLCYRAIDFGPVPEHWDRIYSFFDEIQQEIVHFSSGKEGTRLTSTLSPDMSEFSEQERNLLDTVYHHFRAMSSTQISETSHKEEAWKKNVGTAGLIDYHLAFGLKAI